MDVDDLPPMHWNWTISTITIQVVRNLMPLRSKGITKMVVAITLVHGENVAGLQSITFSFKNNASQDQTDHLSERARDNFAKFWAYSFCIQYRTSVIYPINPYARSHNVGR